MEGWECGRVERNWPEQTWTRTSEPRRGKGARTFTPSVLALLESNVGSPVRFQEELDSMLFCSTSFSSHLQQMTQKQGHLTSQEESQENGTVGLFT